MIQKTPDEKLDDFIADLRDFFVDLLDEIWIALIVMALFVIAFRVLIFFT